jgi:tRNA-dihydrouridine synthase B
MVGRGRAGPAVAVGRDCLHSLGHAGSEGPEGAALADLVAGHYEAMLSFYGATLACGSRASIWAGMPRLAGARPDLRAAMLTATARTRVLALIARGFCHSRGLRHERRGDGATDRADLGLAADAGLS